MTSRLAPGSPPLTKDGPAESGPIADSEWEELDNPGEEEQVKANLTKIAKAKRSTKK